MKTEEIITLLPDIIKQYAVSAQLKLPVFPGAAFELRQLLLTDDASIDQISNIIGKDQAIAGHVLRLANSTLYSGANRSIRTIKDAVIHLGSDHILNIIICRCQHTYYKSQNAILAKYLQILWQHAMCVAIGSKWLLAKLGKGNITEEGFLAGLLHDIGKLLIIKVIETIHYNHPDMDLKTPFIPEIVYSLHSELGYQLLNSWKIPNTYCNIALNHNRPDFDRDDILLISVRISNNVSKKLCKSISPEKPGDFTQLPEVEPLGIDEKVLGDLEAAMLDAMQSEYSILNESQLDTSTPYGIYL